ncbi:MAG: Glu/Leu/Phe/Val dehydrogenase [Planctomycetes bacterium]|nr:Glu/Leu/Phe/Val dehydrogenase [Planctomycetota bacterium]
METIHSPPHVEYDDLAPSSHSMEDENPFASMMASFDEAADRSGLDSDLYALLRKPDREIMVSVPTKLDDGTLAIFEGYRVQHNSGLGPYFGPLRIHAGLKVEELRALAGWMTWKCALLNVPFGGSAGGIRMSAKRHSRGELERAVRRYVSNMIGDIGAERDIFAGDLATDEELLAWVMDTVSMHSRTTENASVCGKPLKLGGTYGNAAAVAQGMRILLGPALERSGLPRTGARVIIQGAGRRGGNLAQLLAQDGQIVVGMSDMHGGIYNEKGLDVSAAVRARIDHDDLRRSKGSFEVLSGEEIIERPCDVFMPCAVANVVHLRNARELQCKLIVEGSHAAVSQRSDRILAERGIAVVPDILATGGGTVVNYFEWVQNRAGYSWLPDVVQHRLERFMLEAWDEVAKVAKEQNSRLRMAAHMVAVTRVAAADKLRGLYA